MKDIIERKFKYRAIDSSRDERTNVWQVTCIKCNKVFSPPTTMLAKQVIVCPNVKCNETEEVNYNEL